MNVTIVDYGVGNLHSVSKAFQIHGAHVEVTSDPTHVVSADRLVLPGVGAFADGMAALEARSLVDALREFVKSGRPFLGICLGMQLLLSHSEEFGLHPGLGIIEGRVVPISGHGVKVPHVGWNAIYPSKGRAWANTILSTTEAGSMAYFVHSYYAAPSQEEHWLAETTYGDDRMAASIQKDNVVGCQFHPEKSGPGGLKIIGRFLEC